MPWYGILMLVALIGSAIYWSRLARRDERLIVVYLMALGGAFLGAKIVYLLSEGAYAWNHPEPILHLLTGKSVTGALLGGYASVEFGKWLIGYKKPTGDAFALAVPLGLILGRIGCLTHGCCLGVECEPTSWWAGLATHDPHGVARWPASLVELAFNASFFFALLGFKLKHMYTGQLFHLYLMAYGAFRFAHEFFRDTPKDFLGLSGYQFAALALVLLGAIGYARRARGQRQTPAKTARQALPNPVG